MNTGVSTTPCRVVSVPSLAREPGAVVRTSNTPQLYTAAHEAAAGAPRARRVPGVFVGNEISAGPGVRGAAHRRTDGAPRTGLPRRDRGRSQRELRKRRAESQGRG